MDHTRLNVSHRFLTMVVVGMVDKVEQQKQVNSERLKMFDINQGQRILSCCWAGAVMLEVYL